MSTKLARQRIKARLEFEASLRSAQRLFQRTLDVIDAFEAIENGQPVPDSKEPATIADAVRQVVRVINGVFDISQVNWLLSQLFPEISKSASASAISNALAQLAQDSDLVSVVRPGRGRSPTMYESFIVSDEEVRALHKEINASKNDEPNAEALGSDTAS